VTQRQQKVGELLKSEISEIIRRELRDPRVGFVTVTDAEITPDMSHARVFVSVLGSDEERAATMKALRRASGFIRSEFARRVSMKTVPEIEFRFDKSIEQGARIFELLENIKREEEGGEGSEPSGREGEGPTEPGGGEGKGPTEPGGQEPA
jgi:ribosome-binding factor A